tara:strand:- start:1598 stop:2380 length:783 start_codon:yes stop_codon:yes gene_type:complete
MKKSQLRNIIRESIKELMNEQSNSNVTVSVGDIVAVAAAMGYGLTNPQDLPSPGINNTPFSTLVGGGFPGFQINNIGNTISSNCGYAKAFEIIDQAAADEFNNIFSGQVGVYLEIITNYNPNTNSGGQYNSVQSVISQLNADFQGAVGSCTYVGFIPTPLTQSTWKCAALPSGGAVAEQVSMSMGCIEVSDGSGQFANEGMCLSQNTNIPNGCGGTNMGALVKPLDVEPKSADIKRVDPEVTDPQIDRMNDLAFRGKRKR